MAAQWLAANEKTIVKHVDRYSSDHCMLLLDATLELRKNKRSFYFDKQWVDKHGIKDIIRNTWELDYISSPMFKVG